MSVGFRGEVINDGGVKDLVDEVEIATSIKTVDQHRDLQRKPSSILRAPPVHRVALCFVRIAVSRHGVTVAMVVTTTAVRGGSLFTDSRGFAWLSENDFTPAWKSLPSWYLVARND